MNWRDDLYAAFVNLDSRKDRLKHMEAELARVDIKAERLRGMLPSEFKGDKSKVHGMFNRTPGAVGCHFSQVAVMNRAKDRGKHAFVMEDDLIFCSDIHKRLDYISAWMESNEWDVFWLGGTFHSPAFWHPKGPSRMPPNCSANLGKDCEPTQDLRIMRTYGAFSTYAYIVNVESIDKIKELFEKDLPRSIGIDWLFIKIQPLLKAYAFVPGSVKQMDNRSDIGTGVTRFSGFAQLNGSVSNSRYWFADKMEDFNPKGWTWK